MARFASYATSTYLIDAFRRDGPLALGMGPAGALDFADLFRALGRSNDERQTLENYVNRPVVGSHVIYLTNYLTLHGHDDLVTRIQIV